MIFKSFLFTDVDDNFAYFAKLLIETLCTLIVTELPL